MHIMDGILTPFWIVFWLIIAAPFLIIGILRIAAKRRENPAHMTLLAFMGAIIFIVSIWHIPVPVTGSCSHPCGVALSAIIVGPFETSVLTFIALFIQLFLAHGGITALGANIVSMGIVGGFLGYGTYLLFRRFRMPIWVAAGIAGFIGDLTTYVVTAGQVALSLYPEASAYYWLLFSAAFLPTQLPLAVLDFLITATLVKYLVDMRPEILKGGMVYG
ncbi:MAG: energy-coupling factor ABC transporter permease [Nitrososphaerota archaeon]|nr:energy-coupling factor ABC transporter permease [Nitrososphaerota archaeon]